MQVQQRTKDIGAALADMPGAQAGAGGSVFATAGDVEASNGKEDPCNA